MYPYSQYKLLFIGAIKIILNMKFSFICSIYFKQAKRHVLYWSRGRKEGLFQASDRQTSGKKCEGP